MNKFKKHVSISNNFWLCVSSFFLVIGIGCIFNGLLNNIPFNHYWEYVGSDRDMAGLGVSITAFSLISLYFAIFLRIESLYRAFNIRTSSLTFFFLFSIYHY